jgi:hypothetical protein
MGLMPTIKRLIARMGALLSMEGPFQALFDEGFAHPLDGGLTHLQGLAEVGIGPAGLIGFE